MKKLKKFLKALQAYFMYQKPPKADYEKIWQEEAMKEPPESDWLREVEGYDRATVRATRRYRKAMMYWKQGVKEDKQALRKAIVQSLFE